MFTTIAWRQNVDLGAVNTPLDAVPDQHIDTEGDFIRVPQGMSNLMGAIATSAAATLTSATIESPSLRQLSNQDIEPISALTDNLSAIGEAQMHPRSPRPLAVGESLEFFMNTDDAAAQEHVGAAWLSDGPQQPVTGDIFTVRATATIAQAAGAWVAGNITFAQRLPVTTYDVVGLHVRAATGVLGRLIFIGGPWRPGVGIAHAITDNPGGMFRYGRMGVLGTFHINQPPQLEMLGGAAAAQTILLDLIRRG